jgi:hypothetical protein
MCHFSFWWQCEVILYPECLFFEPQNIFSLIAVGFFRKGWTLPELGGGG